MKLGTMFLTAFLVGMSLSPLQAKKAAITIKPQKLTLYVKQSKTLKLYKGKKSVKAKWKTGNKKIAKVSAKGKVTALKAGKTKIIATYAKKKYYASLTVKKKKKKVQKATSTAAPAKTPATPAVTTTPTTTTTPAVTPTPTPSTNTTPTPSAEKPAEKPSEEKPAETPSVSPEKPSEEKPAEQPAETPSETKQEMPTIEIGSQAMTMMVDKDGNPSTSPDATPVEVERKTAQMTWTTLPTNINELKQYEELLKDKEKGKFVIYTLLAATLKTYDDSLPREKNQTMYDMMSYLCDSPWALQQKMPFNTAPSRQFIDNCFYYNKGKAAWFGNAFFENSYWKEGYKLSAPYIMHLHEHVYLTQAATTTTPEYERIANNGSHYNPDDSMAGNFSSPKILDVTWSESAGRWYIYSTDWKHIMNDGSVKAPDASISW